MKRLLLTFAALLSLVCAMAANSIDWSVSTHASAKGWESGTTKLGNQAINLNDDISLTISDFVTAPVFNGSAIRIYKGSKVTFAGASGVKITKLVITCESATYAPEPAATSSGTASVSDAVITWTGSTNSLAITNSATTQLRVKSVVATYTGGTGTDSGNTGGNTGGSTGTPTGDGTTVYFIAPDCTSHSGTKLMNSDGSSSVSSSSASASLVGQSFTSGNVNISFGRSSGSYTASFGSLVRWYANNYITVTPANGYAVTRIEVPYSGSSYKGPFTTTVGEVDSSSNPVVWTGSTTEALRLTPSAQMRFDYIAVTVAPTSGGGNTGGGSTGGDDDRFTPIYILGDMNSWTPSAAWKFSTTDGVNYTLNVSSFPAVSEFKIADPTYSVANWGGCTAIRPNITYYLSQNGCNNTMDAIAANATVTINIQTGAYKVASTKLIGGMKAPSGSAEGWPAGYQGVMLQGFYWDSHEDTNWGNLEYQASELAQYFKLIWVPNSGCSASNPGMGYDPVFWFTNHNSSFGSESALRSLIKTLKAKGVGLIADVVVNHRSGTSNWTDFPAETWNGITYKLDHRHICSNDEVAWASGQPTPGGNPDTGDGFDGSRDLDHTNSTVQANIKAYCQFLLEDLGYVGFRYDMVKGYGGGYTKMYNEYSVPTYSVGEFFDMDYNAVAGWIESTGRTSAAFDFPFKKAVNEAFGSGDMRKLVWQANGNNNQPAGLIHNGYPRYAVTFIDNHDTYRDNNRFYGNILAANAFMLMSPGTPCVFLPHWKEYKRELAYIIALRNSVGINNTSHVDVLRSTSDCYMAKVYGTNGDAIVKIGPAMVTPDGFNDADLKAYGPDYAIWTKVHVTGQEIKREYPSKLYLIGNVNGNNWSTSNPVAASKSADGVFTWNEVTVNRADGSSMGYITLVTAKGANWDAVNAANRFGALTDNAELTTSAEFKAYPANFNASGARSWTVMPGTYKVVVDFNSMRIELTPIATSAQSTAFVAGGYTGLSGTALTNIDGTTTGSASNSLLNKSFTAGHVTLTSTGGGSSKAGVYNNLVRWYKGNVINLRAESGYAITRVEVNYTGSSYAGPFTASTGVVDSSSNPVEWKGHTANLDLTASGQMRFNYIVITVEPSDVVVEPEPASAGAYYTPVTKASDIKVGETYIVVAQSTSKAVGTDLSKTSTGYLNAVNVTVSTDKTVYVADPAKVMHFTLEAGTNSSSSALSFTDGGTTYYLAAPSTSTTLSRTTTKSTSNNVILAQSGSIVNINFVKNSRRLNYGTANGGCFQAYAASSSSKLVLYKKSTKAVTSTNVSSCAIVNYVAPTNEDVEGVRLLNTDGSTRAEGNNSTSATLYGASFAATDGAGETLVTLENTVAKTYYPGAYDNLVYWYKNAVMTLTPAEGMRITRVEVEYASNEYSGPFSADNGTVTADTEEKTIVWTGSTSAPLNLTAGAQIRFSVMSVTLRPALDEEEAPATEYVHPEGLYVYLENDAEWQHPYAYTWTEGDSDHNAAWPGVAMTRVANGIWVYELPTDVAPANIIFNDGVVGSGNQTEDLAFENAKTYNNAEFDGIHEIYLVGDFTDEWSFLDDYRFDSEDGVAYTLYVDEFPEGGNFKIASKFYAPLNYGGASASIVNGATVTLEPGTSTNSVIAEGLSKATLNFNIDSNSLHVSGVNTTGVETVTVGEEEAPVYYNLQGIRIDNPTSGIYIVRRGATTAKVLVK